MKKASFSLVNPHEKMYIRSEQNRTEHALYFLSGLIGYLPSIKQDIFKISSFITGDKNDFLSPLVLTN